MTGGAFPWGGLLGAVLLAAGLTARVIITRLAADSAVDQYYWLLVAKAYRDQRGLPVRISNKYLMEDETQAYPPLFGWLLARLPERWRGHLTIAVEVGELVVLLYVLLALGAEPMALIIGLGVYLAAPVLVVYNAQLTPRILGDFFLFAALVCQLAAVELVTAETAQVALWVASVGFVALIVMTHKMTLQLYAVLLPFWAWALDSLLVPAAAIGGLALYVLIVGPYFAAYQFRAHWDIVRFWNRYWRGLGAHQFKHSPIYGDPKANRDECFHVPGCRGALRHLRLVVSYAPFNPFLPLASLAGDAWPPVWVLVWLVATYSWVLVTLYVPRLKCLGGGHLYVFNTIAPSVLYLAFLPLTAQVLGVLLLGVGLTLVSLILAIRVVARRPIARHDDSNTIVEEAAIMPAGRFAVFPLQAAEVVAACTPHAVLWGGHGYGFRNLEGFFPILEQPLGFFLRKYKIDWVLWKRSFWPKAVEQLLSEGILAEDVEVIQRGEWCLAQCNASSVAARGDIS